MPIEPTFDDEIEALGTQGEDGRAQFTPVAGKTPALTLEWNNARQVGIAVEQRQQAALKKPVDFAPGEMLAEQTQDGQGLHHVAERAGFEDEDFQGVKRNA